MIKNILIALLIGLLVGGVVLWHYLPAKVVEKEHLVMHYDTTYQTITKIKIVIKDTCHHNNDTSYADADSIIVVDTTTTGPDTVKIPVTVLAPTKTWSALPMVGYTGGVKLGVGIGYKNDVLNYEYNFGHKEHGVYLQKIF